MEDRVGSGHLVAEVKAVGARVDGLNNGIRAKSYDVELVGGANGLDMLAEEPDLVSRLEVGLWLAMLVIVTFL
jgi:hypothetical protein